MCHLPSPDTRNCLAWLRVPRSPFKYTCDNPAIHFFPFQRWGGALVVYRGYCFVIELSQTSPSRTVLAQTLMKTTLVFILGGVVLVKGLVHLTRQYLNRNRRFKRFQRLLDGGNSLSRTPQGYEELHLSAKQAEDNIKGLKLGPRIGYGSSGTVFNGDWLLRLLSESFLSNM